MNPIPKEELEEKVIEAVLAFYKPYLQKDGRNKLAEIIKQQTGAEQEDVAGARQWQAKTYRIGSHYSHTPQSIALQHGNAQNYIYTWITGQRGYQPKKSIFPSGFYCVKTTGARAFTQAPDSC
jgi:hypothetical protein